MGRGGYIASPGYILSCRLAVSALSTGGIHPIYARRLHTEGRKNQQVLVTKTRTLVELKLVCELVYPLGEGEKPDDKTPRPVFD